MPSRDAQLPPPPPGGGGGGGGGAEGVRNACTGLQALTVSLSAARTRQKKVPDPSGDFCRRGGRFGPHSSNESFTPIYHGRLVFIAYFNAGVRAVDIRDPFHPVEAGFFIPDPTSRTDKRCIEVAGAPLSNTRRWR